MSEVNFIAKIGLHKSFVYLFRPEVELQSKRTITLQPKVWSLELYGLLHAALYASSIFPFLSIYPVK